MTEELFLKQVHFSPDFIEYHVSIVLEKKKKE